jgi:hypothetical protein
MPIPKIASSTRARRVLIRLKNNVLICENIRFPPSSYILNQSIALHALQIYFTFGRLVLDRTKIIQSVGCAPCLAEWTYHSFMTNPTGYGSYAAKSRKAGVKQDTRAAKFASRYKFAGQLNSIELLGYSTKSSEVYLILLRLCLAYSALEQLQVLVDQKNLPIKHEQLARELKSDKFRKFQEFLVSESKDALKGELKKFLASKRDTNLGPVVRAIRHTMFHGSLNPSRAGLGAKSASRFLENLEMAVFTTMDRSFSEWLSSHNLD